MELSDSQKKHLKGLAHDLNPVVMIGQHGLKPSIMEAIDQALEHHQLIKIRISADNRDLRDEWLAKILEHVSEASVIQKIGHIVVLYQRNPKKPDMTRHSS
ncbi:MAG: ribosome assembly RNA-binding protein YhbY [Proteobacteria bacterium]|nr:MAG: ribosome assembly RNA-binding protein YhbY [Pseudomonadota bacterium]